MQIGQDLQAIDAALQELNKARDDGKSDLGVFELISREIRTIASVMPNVRGAPRGRAHELARVRLAHAACSGACCSAWTSAPASPRSSRCAASSATSGDLRQAAPVDRSAAAQGPDRRVPARRGLAGRRGHGHRRRARPRRAAHRGGRALLHGAGDRRRAARTRQAAQDGRPTVSRPTSRPATTSPRRSRGTSRSSVVRTLVVPVRGMTCGGCVAAVDERTAARAGSRVGQCLARDAHGHGDRRGRRGPRLLAAIRGAGYEGVPSSAPARRTRTARRARRPPPRLFRRRAHGRGLRRRAVRAARRRRAGRRRRPSAPAGRSSRRPRGCCAPGTRPWTRWSRSARWPRWRSRRSSTSPASRTVIHCSRRRRCS